MARNTDILLTEKRKQAILDLLNEELPTSKIAVLINDNYYRVDIFLRELEKEKKVEKVTKGRATYWKKR